MTLVRRTSGALTGADEPDYLARLREDWPSVIVLDANVLIAHLYDDDAFHARAETALTEAASEPFASSTIMLAEVLVGPARRDRLAAALTAIETLKLAEIRSVPMCRPGSLGFEPKPASVPTAASCSRPRTPARVRCLVR